MSPFSNLFNSNMKFFCSFMFTIRLSIFNSFAFEFRCVIASSFSFMGRGFKDNFSKIRHIFGKMLQIMVSLKMIIWLKKIKKTESFHWLCSSRKDQTLTIWHFQATTPNSDLNIYNNVAKKKMIKN